MKATWCVSMADFYDSAWFGLGLPLGSLAFLVVLLVLGVNSCERDKCQTVGAETGRAVRYDMKNGCRIQDKGRFVPLDRWRVLDD